MEHSTLLRGLLLALSASLFLAIAFSYIQEFHANQRLTPIDVLEAPHSTQVLVMNFLYQKVKRLAEIRPEALKPYLNDYTTAPDPSFDLFYLPRRENYCQANFLHTMLNPESREEYVFMDAPNTDALKKSLNHEFDFLNTLVFRKRDFTKKEIERLQNMEWSPKINLFYTRTNLFYNNVVGRTSVCVFQMTSKVPGSSIFHRTDLLIDKMRQWAPAIDAKGRVRVADFFPGTYRLYNAKECQQFFEVIQSKKFKTQMRHRVVFTIKNAQHTRDESLDFLEIHKLMRIYKKGALCGQFKNWSIIQEYNNNQLKFKNGRKFVLRVYLAILSTDPLLVVMNKGVALLDRFNNYVPFTKSVVNATEVFSYLRESGSIGVTDQEEVYEKIKRILYELNEFAKPHYLKDHRFFQTFAFDFILTSTRNPVLVNWSGAPRQSKHDAKFVKKLLRIEMNLLHAKIAAIREYILGIRMKILNLLKDRWSRFEYLEDFVYQMDQMEEFQGPFDNRMRELLKNPIRSLKRGDLEGMEVLFSEPGVLSWQA